MDDWSDADLLQGIRDGERWAWDQLVKKHERRLWAIARARGLDPDAAHDALQGTWLRLLDHVDRIREPAALGGWLATVTRHEAIGLSKQRARERDRAERLGGQQTLDGAPADADIVLGEDLAGVASAFGQLSERCQQLLRLVFSSAELSYADIADDLGVPIGSLGPTRARCLAKLRRLLS
jgi:RNA polymerase sigma factor (sigma-70 family)